MDQILAPSVLSVIAEVNPDGSATTVVVRYGEHATLDQRGVRQSIGAGSAPVKVSWQLTGLHPASTYHFQVVATNALGQSASPSILVEMPASSPGSTIPASSAPPTFTPPSLPTGSADSVRAVMVSRVSGAFSALNAVACPSLTFCLAVGTTGPSMTRWHPLVERFGGRAFNVVPSPTPWHAQLLGISCSTPRFCLAVGGDGNNTFSERWNGTGWRVLPTPSPRLDGGDLLSDVACVSVTDCVGVGVENGGTKDARPLAEHWNGVAWTVVGTPSVASAVFTSLSCPSATSCFVVGIKDDASGLGRPLIEHWNGRAFVLSPTPPVGGQLFSVACGAPASCVAVGNGGGRALLLDFAGGSWHLSPPLHLADFSATACVSASSCVAAGGTTAHWNGRSWAFGQPAVAYGTPSGEGQGAELGALSCPAPTECVGVGGLIRLARGPGAPGSERIIADVISLRTPGGR
ncbi:MAG: hypothetical protein M0004_01835 [Actinomycetota bacterium]|nr:hypothetical protein [Actinomycetota bacterium]